MYHFMGSRRDREDPAHLSISATDTVVFHDLFLMLRLHRGWTLSNKLQNPSETGRFLKQDRRLQHVVEDAQFLKDDVSVWLAPFSPGAWGVKVFYPCPGGYSRISALHLRR